MSTRSLIIRKTQKGYEGIYCHSDGYPEYTGYLLRNFYKSEAKIRKLIKLGDLSVLGEKIETKLPHNFTNRRKGVTVAYGRDRARQI